MYCTHSLALPFLLALVVGTHMRVVVTEEIKFQQLSKAIQGAKDVLNLISQRYEYGTALGRAFMLMQSNLSEEDFNHLKYSLAVKMLAGKEDSSYLMVFGGSSVTAGHDNQFLDSYPSIVSRELAPILAAAGITLEVRNIAQAANPCLPSDLCYLAMGGEEEADLYSWEQSMNCGHQQEYPELILRLAAASGGMYYHASSGGAHINCSQSKDSPPYSSVDFAASSRNIPFLDTTGEGMMAKLAEWKQDLFQMHRAAGASGSAAIPDALVSQYAKHTAIGGFDKSDKGPKGCTVGAIYASCRLKFLTKEATVYSSANGGGAAWHPSRGLHLMRGELIVWQYALATLDALLMLTADPRMKTRSAWTGMIAEYSARIKVKPPLRALLPPPVHCGRDPTYCHIPSSCFTNFAPHFSERFNLTELVVHSTKHNLWEYTEGLVKNNQLDRPRTQLETRPRYHTSQGVRAGELYFKIKVTAALPAVMLCFGAWTTIKQNYFSHLKFRLDLHADVGDAANLYTPSANRKQWDDMEHKDMKHKNCAILRNIPPGVHVLGVESISDQTAVGVTHIIMWGDVDQQV